MKRKRETLTPEFEGFSSNEQPGAKLFARNPGSNQEVYIKDENWLYFPESGIWQLHICGANDNDNNL